MGAEFKAIWFDIEFVLSTGFKWHVESLDGGFTASESLEFSSESLSYDSIDSILIFGSRGQFIITKGVDYQDGAWSSILEPPPPTHTHPKGGLCSLDRWK